MSTVFTITITPHPVTGYMIKAGWYEGKSGFFELKEPFIFNPTPSNLLSGLLNQLTAEKLKTNFGYSETGFEQFLTHCKKEELQEKILPAFTKIQSKALIEAIKANIPLFIAPSAGKLRHSQRLEVVHTSLNLKIELLRKDQEIIYRLKAEKNEKPFPLTGEGLLVLRWADPVMLIKGTHLYILNHPTQGKILQPFLEKDHLCIPLRAQELYFQKFLRRAAAEAMVEGEGFKTLDIKPEPRCILTASQAWDGNYGFSLTFLYEEIRLQPNEPRKIFTSLGMVESDLVITRIHRNPELEQHYLRKLKALGFQLHGAWLSIRATSVSNSLTNILDFLSQNKNHLEQQGFIIETQFDHDYIFAIPSLSLRIDLKNDWFDLNITVIAGEFQFPFSALKDHILEGRPDFELPNGRVFRIPDAWFARYGALFQHAQVKSQILRLHKTQHILLVDLEPSYSSFPIPETFHLPDGLPTLNGARLRNYQSEGYRWLTTHWKAATGALLADDMGLGKTLQIIALLKKIYEHYDFKRITQDSRNGQQLSLFDELIEVDKNERNYYPPSLVVTPASVVHNWEAELRRFAPELTFYSYTGPDREIHSFKKFSVILTTYGILRNDIEQLERTEFGCVILDESQNIKNPSSQNALAAGRLNSRHRFCLSGTPVENRPEELWSQMNFLNPGLLGTLSHFNKYYGNAGATNESLTTLKKITAPYILRRNKHEVLSELPPLNEVNLLCDMLPDQEQIYEQEKSKQRNQLLESERVSPQFRMHVLKALMRLRLLAIDPRILNGEDTTESGKTSAITAMLETLAAEGHKILVFSSFVKYLHILSRWCESQGLEYRLLTGQTRNRPQVIDDFRKRPEIKIFLISLKAGGVGLNLTEAGYVLLTDPWWNLSAERQAIDRAHRMGQQNPVFVYRFITRLSVEEKIEKIKVTKNKMAAGLLDDAAMMRHIAAIPWEDWLSRE